MNAQHSAATSEHGTPPDIIALTRYALGGIDLDPCSSAYWNHHAVKATRFYDKRSNGLKQPWSGRLIVNPAGPVKHPVTKKLLEPSLVRPMWECLVDHWLRSAIEGAVWVGFSLEQLVQLQYRTRRSPLQCLGVVPEPRTSYLEYVEGGPPVLGESPTHGSYVVLFTDRRSRINAEGQVARFVERASKMGTLWRPW